MIEWQPSIMQYIFAQHVEWLCCMARNMFAEGSVCSGYYYIHIWKKHWAMEWPCCMPPQMPLGLRVLAQCVQSAGNIVCRKRARVCNLLPSFNWASTCACVTPYPFDSKISPIIPVSGFRRYDATVKSRIDSAFLMTEALNERHHYSHVNRYGSR